MLHRPLLSIALLAVTSLAAPLLAAGPDFTRDVRPILARHCFKCHGPDDLTREGGLRLDERASAVKGADSGEIAIVPGQPGNSELVQRITSADEAEVMPPPTAKQRLTDAEKETLRQWIAAGAEYQAHWSFERPVRPAAPAVNRPEWLRNSIDAFVLARLDREGLSPSAEADRETLIRRVSLDLIGLPPTPEEVDQFVADPAPDAYDRLVDRLLASPRYGERWARRWLDLARYADTNGYEKDRQRSVWPWRDWVINAINAGMPFDQFTIEQLAGDLLPDATLEQRIATGFHRNTMTNEEGGIDPQEFQFYALCDRVNTTGATWLGLTLACTQCHTHKYDPLPHQDYYGLMAFLNNADEIKLEVPTPELLQRREVLERTIAERTAKLAENFPGTDSGSDPATRRQYLENRFSAWLAEQRAAAVDWKVLQPVSAKADLSRFEILSDGSLLASGDQTKRDEYDLVLRGDLRGVTGLRLEALPDPSLPKGGPGRTYYEGPEGDFFLSEWTVDVDGQPLKFASATETYGKLGIGGGQAAASLTYDGEFQTGWSTSGREGEPHAAFYTLAAPLQTASDASEVHIRMVFERHYSADLGRFRISATRDPRPLTARETPAEIESLLVQPPRQLMPSDIDRLQQYFLQTAPELTTTRAEIEQLRKQIPAPPTTLAFVERPANFPRETHRRHRGEFLQPKETVPAHTPGVLPPLSADVPRNRLTLAQWLVSPENPLTARVVANRNWSAFFGRGIVKTQEDFGLQGAAPTHPELLDWLATELVRQQWSLKAFHRRIVTSATYRQDSRVSPELAERDPENLLFARGPRVRLEAELVRDTLLATAGLLSDKLLGPSVFPPQPANVTTEGTYGGLAWTVSPGEDRHRRGLYTFTKRTSPYAMFSTFDGPSGEACIPRRDVTNTPLQALTLLNDPVALEIAQHLGTEFAGRTDAEPERLRILFRRCLTRSPAPEELTLLQKYLDHERNRLQANAEAAGQIAGPGTGLAAERAAWTLTARALINLDEFVVKD